MKTTLFGLILFSAMIALAQQSDSQGRPPGPPPHLTQEQKACLDGILGAPGEGAPPTREQFQAAAKTCHLPPPPAGHRPASTDGGSEDSD